MATYDLTRAQLDAALGHNFDAQTRAAIIDYLNNAHAFDPKVTVDKEPFPANSNADVFSVQSTFATVNTDDPPKVIPGPFSSIKSSLFRRFATRVATGLFGFRFQTGHRLSCQAFLFGRARVALNLAQG